MDPPGFSDTRPARRPMQILASLSLLLVFFSAAGCIYLLFGQVQPPLSLKFSLPVILVSALVLYWVSRHWLDADLHRKVLLEKSFRDGLLHGFPGLFAMSDSSGTLVSWNPRFAEISGMEPDRLKHLQLWQAFGESHHQTLKRSIEQAYREGRQEIEILFMKEGTPLSLHLTLVVENLGGKKSLLCFGTDITEFRRVEDARRAGVDSPLQSLAIHLDGRIVYANPGFENLSGYSASELYLMDSGQVLGLIHEPDRPKFADLLQILLKQEKTVMRAELRITRKDGYQRWMEASFHPINFRERAAIQIVALDCTERKDTEAQQARLIAELEAKNAELERFTYTVSHDLKSPLITIRGFLGFLERDAIAHNKARIQADLERITEATDKMQLLLNDLLKLSRVGHGVNPPEDLPFETVVKEAVERVGGQILRRGSHIKIEAGLPVVRVDRERAVEIVQNLVDNAVKFMGDQSDPQIEIGSCGTEGSGMAILFVKDNGIGIEPQFHDRIFGLFNKLDPQSEGTGVGLAVVRRIVEAHGGKIWVLSKGRGTGSTFYFTLPLAMKTN